MRLEPERPSGPWRRSRRCATRAGRRCSCSTTPIARLPRFAPPRASSARPSPASLRSSWPPARRPLHSPVWGRATHSGSSRSTLRPSGRSRPCTRRRPTVMRCPWRRCWRRVAASRGACTKPRASGRAREAARRVDAVADRTAAGRDAARALQTELAGSVVDLQVARERSDRTPRGRADMATVCPYKGLATFDVTDAEYFFGREQLVADLVARLVGSQLLGVVGASGSGKSSAVRAGLLPALAGGVLPGSDAWAQALIRPGDHPLRELRTSPAPLRGSPRRPRRGPVRGGVHSLPRRVPSALRSWPASCAPSHAGTPRRRTRRARRLLRPLWRLSGAGRIAGREPGAGRTDVSRRATPGDRAACATRGAERRAGADRRPARRRRGPGRARCPCSPPRCSSSGGSATAAACGSRRTAAAAGLQGAVARLAEDAFLALDAEQQRIARNVLLRLAGEGEGGAIVRRRAVPERARRCGRGGRPAARSAGC